jgi:hypothetical protein
MRCTEYGYKTLIGNLFSFSQIGCLPKSIDLSRLDDGEGIQSTFQNHKAKWYDSCKLKYNNCIAKDTEKEDVDY